VLKPSELDVSGREEQIGLFSEFPPARFIAGDECVGFSGSVVPQSDTLACIRKTPRKNPPRNLPGKTRPFLPEFDGLHLRRSRMSLDDLCLDHRFHVQLLPVGRSILEQRFEIDGVI
jgi:hypothetical protein